MSEHKVCNYYVFTKVLHRSIVPKVGWDPSRSARLIFIFVHIASFYVLSRSLPSPPTKRSTERRRRRWHAAVVVVFLRRSKLKRVLLHSRPLRSRRARQKIHARRAKGRAADIMSCPQRIRHGSCIVSFWQRGWVFGRVP